MAKQAIKRDLYADAIHLPRYVDARVLAASTAETVTIPSDVDFIVFSGNVALADYYVKIGGTAAVPSGDVTDGSSAFANPGYAIVERGGSFSVISPTGGVLTMAMFAAMGN